MLECELYMEKHVILFIIEFGGTIIVRLMYLSDSQSTLRSQEPACLEV